MIFGLIRVPVANPPLRADDWQCKACFLAEAWACKLQVHYVPTWRMMCASTQMSLRKMKAAACMIDKTNVTEKMLNCTWMFESINNPAPWPSGHSIHLLIGNDEQVFKSHEKHLTTLVVLEGQPDASSFDEEASCTGTQHCRDRGVKSLGCERLQAQQTSSSAGPRVLCSLRLTMSTQCLGASCSILQHWQQERGLLFATDILFATDTFSALQTLGIAYRTASKGGSVGDLPCWRCRMDLRQRPHMHGGTF